MNRGKSATNSAVCADFAELIEGAAGYKYPGNIDDKTGVPKRECFEKVRAELLARVERLRKTRLSARHLFHAINEHALSLINHYVGVLRLEPKDFEELDHAVRQCLSRHGLHAQPACKERLYLPRAQLGRGLHCLAFRSELMLTQLSSTLQSSFETSTRRAAIWTVEAQAKTHLSLIGGYIVHKYGMEATDDVKTIREAQWRALYGEINQKIEHKKLYRATGNEIVSMPG
ncbi:hypothetical protein PAPHI01_1423 [Pancytospora philotis]|nr:hypothetical protein PAPHI01_1423 [Pancytospora philotis]